MTPASLSEEEIFQVARRIDSAEARRAYLGPDMSAMTRRCGNRSKRCWRLRRVGKFSRSLRPRILRADIPTRDQPITEQPGDRSSARTSCCSKSAKAAWASCSWPSRREPVQRTVALKIIKPGMDTRQVIARFEAERQALALMDHPNIARVLDAGTTDTGRPVLRHGPGQGRARSPSTATSTTLLSANGWN